MPNKPNHLRQAQHNKTFFESINQQLYSDWAATALFYTGLHYIDAYFATQNIHPMGHPVRDRLINQNAVLRAVYGDYRSLKDASHNARYNPPNNRFSQLEITNLNDNSLQRIITLLDPQLYP